MKRGPKPNWERRRAIYQTWKALKEIKTLAEIGAMFPKETGESLSAERVWEIVQIMKVEMTV